MKYILDNATYAYIVVNFGSGSDYIDLYDLQTDKGYDLPMQISGTGGQIFTCESA